MRLLMIIKLLIGIGVLLVGVLVISSCRTVEIVHYVHEPSESFYKNMDFHDKGIEKFKDEGIIFVVDVKEVRRDQYFVWLGLYSDKQQTIIINEARISGNGWGKKSQIGQEVVIDSKVFGGALVKGSVQLFNVTGDLLDQVVRNGSGITLEVYYSMSGKKDSMTFSLERRVEKQTVFRT